ncbi:MAG TPA: efflux RND transporter periplasmic adaptor subunit [Gemmatimonadaceae bacterium]|jgi:RND family efflux transporter MFP subunit
MSTPERPTSSASNGQTQTPHYEPPHEHGHIDAHEHHVDVGSAPPVKPASSRRMLMIGTSIVVVLAALFVTAFLPRRAVSRELTATASAVDGPPSVQIVPVVRASAGGDLMLPGTIQALHEGAIYARVGGYVKQWHADIGTIVRAGDVLAEIDAPELEQEVQQAQQQVAQTQAALGLAKADLARWTSLAADSAVSREELDQKTAAYNAAVANNGAADANVRRLTEMQRFTRVTAPFAGVVTARNIDIGSLIGANGSTGSTIAAGGTAAQSAGSLFRLAQTDTVRTYVSVSEADAPSIAAGLVADVTVQEVPNRTFVGRVVRTAGALDAASRTMLTEIDVANPGFVLVPGMYAQARLHLTRRTPALIVPASALLVRSNGTQVVVVDNANSGNSATIHFVPVVVGRDFGGTLEIQSGLSEGANIVSNPSADLTDGMKVQVVVPTANPKS